jgi:hypothetical protein
MEQVTNLPILNSQTEKDPEKLILIKNDIELPRYDNPTELVPIPSSYLTEMNRIKNGFYHLVVLKARQKLINEGKDSYDSYRLYNVPCFIVGLKTTGATKDEYYTSHITPLLVIDLDNKSEDPNKNKEILKSFPWVVAVGKSVGGVHLFAIVKCDPLQHKQSYDSVVQILKQEGVTVASGQYNVNRLRYLSYDPDLYFNPEPLSASNVPIVSKEAVKNNSKKQVFVSADLTSRFKKMVTSRLEEDGVRLWQNGSRHNGIVPLITWANRLGFPLEDCLELAEEHIRPVLEDGNDYDLDKEVRNVYRQYGHEHNTLEWVEELPGIPGCFWTVTDKLKIIIHHSRLLGLLNKNGFAIYFLDKTQKTYTYIRTVGNIVEEVTTVMIGQFIKEYINGLPAEFDGVTRGNLYESFCRGINSYLSEKLLSLLPPANLDFLKDSKKETYFTFRNAVVKVCPGESDNVVLLPYGSLQKVIWKNQVIDFEISIPGTIDNIENGEYYKFITKVNGNDVKKLYYAITIIGYMLNRYKDPSRPFAIVVAEEVEDDKEGGGTGKGIFTKAIAFLRVLITYDGRSDKGDKNFKFQRVSPGTHILCIEDCKRDFDFESYYSPITEGITVEKKGQDEFFIPFEDSPKLLFTTNYVMPNSGNHARRRQKVLAFSNYFSLKYTPEMEFGHLLFTDWNKDEWNLFYNFMFYCAGIYLADGITDIDNSDSINRKQLIVELKTNGAQFLEWFDEYTTNKVEGKDEEKERACSTATAIKILYNQFLEDYDIDKKYFSLIKFSSAIKRACQLFGFEADGDRIWSKVSRGKKEIKLKKIDQGT